MERRYAFGEWMPDIPVQKNQAGLTVCRNVVPQAGGYSPFGSISNLNAFPLPARPQGSLRGQLEDGTNLFYVGTQDDLYRFIETGWSVVSRTTGAYSPVINRRWELAQFGQNVFAADRGNPLQGLSIITDTNFSDVTDAPRAAHTSVANNFLWLGDIISDTLGTARDGVAWSAVNAPFSWPDPTSDAATAVLSGEQKLEGDGGIVNAVVAGSEVTAIFQENAIHRADFVGNDVVWQFTRVEAEHGLLVKGAAVAFERKILYLADDGWRIFNYTSTQNVGKERINDFFFNDWDNDYHDTLTMARDPQATRIYISYAGAGNTDGTPNRILVWDYALDRWSILYPGDHHDLIHSGGISPSIDSPGIPGDIDALGTDPGDGTDTGPPGEESFDQRQLGRGLVKIGAFNSTFLLSDFTGTGLPGRLETGDLELAPGRRALLVGVRPQVDGEHTSIQVAGLDKRGEDVKDLTFSDEFLMARDGSCYPRIDARYHRIRFNLPTAMTDATDYDVTYEPTGKR